MAGRQETPEPLRVLLVDNDPGISELVVAILTDEGYDITALSSPDHDAIAAEVGRTEPDCILLDGAVGDGFGDSWIEAAYYSNRKRAVPTVMFTAHSKAVREARDSTTDRALGANFAGVVAKPFEIDDLVATVEAAAGRSIRFDPSEDGERQRTASLVEELRAAGAADIRTGERREWATFVPFAGGPIHQIYWWQRKGAYIVGRYDDEAHLDIIGRFFERGAAIAAATGSSPESDAA